MLLYEEKHIKENRMKMRMADIDHDDIVRISAIELWHFKSVGHGRACFSSEGAETDADAKNNILAVYGQNGSGKTALIQAVALLPLLLGGKDIPAAFADCIDVAADHADLIYTFTLQSSHIPNAFPPFGFLPGDEVTLYYTVRLARSGAAGDGRLGVRVFGEVLQAKGSFHGNSFNMRTLLDATDPELCPQDGVQDRSSSLLFSYETIHRVKDYPLCYYTEQLLRYYCLHYLIVVDTAADGIVRQNLALPVYSDSRVLTIPMNDVFAADPPTMRRVETYLAGVSRVMEAVVPGLQVQLRDHGPVTGKRGGAKRGLSLVSVRGERELPLRCESDGVRHILSVLWSLIWAYNDPRVTLAVDELDAGVYEFLLGELLQVFQDGGRGQLLFTAHNLRPLEVLNSESILFTTTDPENRYRKLTGLGEGENLRRAYYREILLHEHFDDLYAPTKRHRIAMAMARAAADDTDEDAEGPEYPVDGEGR